MSIYGTYLMENSNNYDITDIALESLSNEIDNIFSESVILEDANDIKEKAKSLIDKVKEFIKGIFKKLKEVFNKVIDKIKVKRKENKDEEFDWVIPLHNIQLQKDKTTVTPAIFEPKDYNDVIKILDRKINSELDGVQRLYSAPDWDTDKFIEFYKDWKFNVIKTDKKVTIKDSQIDSYLKSLIRTKDSLIDKCEKCIREFGKEIAFYDNNEMSQAQYIKTMTAINFVKKLTVVIYKYCSIASQLY